MPKGLYSGPNDAAVTTVQTPESIIGFNPDEGQSYQSAIHLHVTGVTAKR